MNWKVIILSLLLPLGCVAADSYVPRIADPVLEPWRWQEMEELAEQGVFCMDEAADGLLWFGCIGGLARYDGLEVERIPFDEKLLSGIAHNENREPWAMGVLCLQDGSLLVVLESGLVRWINGEWSVVIPNVGNPSYQTRIEKAEDGTIWLLVENALWRISEDLTEQYILLEGGPAERLTTMCHDEQGDIWVILNSFQKSAKLIHIPLLKVSPEYEEDWESYPVELESTGREPRICPGPDGKIWYVDNNANNAIWFFDPALGTWTVADLPDSQKGYYSLIKDKSGTLWAGGTGKLYSIKASGGTYYSPSRLGLPSSPLRIHETAAGKWWVIGRGGYVYAMDPGDGQWLTYEDLHYECDEPGGKQWFLTGTRRVVSHNPTTGDWIYYKLADGVIDWPRSLHVSSHGLVWAAGSHKGRAAIGVFDGMKWTRFEHPEFGMMIEGAVLESADGTMWFGAMGDRLGLPANRTGGALQYEVTSHGKVRCLRHHASSVFPYTIARMAQTRDKTLWLGAPVVQRYDIAKEKVEVVPQLPTVHTQDMVVDGTDHLWIAKGLTGVYRQEASGWRKISGKDALGGKLVVDLLPLMDGTLLAASDLGISRFDGKSWMGNMFSSDFGMSTRSGSMRQSADGSVWFNFTSKDVRSSQVSMNIDSVERYRTVRYVSDDQSPDTFIENHLEHVDSEGNIHISWSGRDVWSNTRRDQLQFSWRIDDGEWAPFSYEVSKTFLNLDNGEHALEVRARDRDFNVDATPAISFFSVALPVWKRGWFVGMVLMMTIVTTAFVGVLIYFHDKRLKDRARHLVEIDQIKTGFFTNISHELRTPLTLILRPLERLLESEENHEKREMLSMAQRNASRVWNLASQLLDFRKLEQGQMRVDIAEGDIVVCVRDVIERLEQAAIAKQISCTVTSPDQWCGWFDAEMVKKIVQNLVNNAIKFTPSGGEVRVALSKRMTEEGGELLILEVEDTGPGIEPVHLQRIFDRFYRIPEKSIVDGSGIGLNLTKELVELLGGTIRAESPVRAELENPGTRFIVSLPIPPNNASGKLPATGDSI
ncbi:sensor histidine kinase [Pontiella sulfatireligans]|nr:ATP-binding protein [Pontiella sulfatireligans]